MATRTPERTDNFLAPQFLLLNVDGKLIDLYRSLAEDKPRAFLLMFICNHCPYVKAILEKLVLEGQKLKTAGISIFAICSNDANDYPEFDGPQPGPNLCVDRTRIRVLIHEEDFGRHHYFYNTVDARWLLDVSHDLAKQMACSESNRVYSVVEEDGRPWLNVYQRNADFFTRGPSLQHTNTIEPPVYAIQRVCYVDMP